MTEPRTTRTERLRLVIDDIAPTEARRQEAQRLRRALEDEARAAVLTELHAAVDGLAADCRCVDDICETHSELCFDGECEDSPGWKRPERLP